LSAQLKNLSIIAVQIFQNSVYKKLNIQKAENEAAGLASSSHVQSGTFCFNVPASNVSWQSLYWRWRS